MTKYILNKLVGKLILIFLGGVITSYSYGQDFVTTWQTDNTGTSNDDQITIPTTGVGYDYIVNWEEVGNPTNNGTITAIPGNITITFPSPGTYQVSISGGFPRIYFNNGGDKEKILTVEQWGTIAWESMASAFYGCSNLTIPASDAPDLTGVIDMSNMFRGASSLNSDFDTWNVGTIENMTRLFQDATLFNGDITTWDVSKVKDMSYLFFFAENFNQDISGWHTDNVTTLRYMFGAALSFNQNINTDFFSGTWNTSNVTNMTGVFGTAESFNQPLDQWDVSNVTTFAGMFNGALAFNQNIDGWNIGTGPSISMSSMFANTPVFNQPLGSWDVSNVDDMRSMFENAGAFDQDLSTWDTRVGNVTNMNSMFAFTSYNRDIIDWDVSNVRDFNGMFQGNTAFNQDISGWTIYSALTVVDMRNMFSGATSFNQDLGSWDVSGLSLAINMLKNSGLSVENYDNLLIGWSSQPLKTGVNFSAESLFYCSAETEREYIISNFSWFITDSGPGCINVYEGIDTSGPQVYKDQAESVDFGSAAATIGKTKSFTIENNLTTSISINSIVFTVPATYNVASPVGSFPIAAGSTQVVTVNFDNASPNTYDDTFSILSDDFPSSFDFPITGIITASTAPEIKVFEGSNPYGTEITDGDVAGYYVGEADRGTDVVSQITILNNGSADLDISNITFTGTAFSATPSIFPITIPVDGSQTIDITLSGSAGGDFTETMNIINNDSDEDPFDFVVTGTIYGPDIFVIDGTDIYSDPHISNGQPVPVELGSSPQGSDLTRQITIGNYGPIDLTVSNISISGAAYSHSATLPITVPAELDGIISFVTFDLILDGTSGGTFAETVTINSDDDSEPTFVFDITGDIIDPNAPKAYWSDADQINRSNLDGSGFEQYHAEPTYKPRGIAIDIINNIVYWTNEWGQIRKGTIDATGFINVSDFINDGIDISRELNGVALDLTARKIYWASTYDGAIKSADLDDASPISTVQTVVSGLLNPIGVAVDPAGKIYYTENDNNGGANDNTATLHQVNFDGSGDVVLSTSMVASEQYTYRDIKLDVPNNMIYWSGGNDDIYVPDGHIYYADISDVSGTVMSYNTFNNSPWGIDLDLTNNKIYWIDILTYMVEPKIGRSDLDGNNIDLLQNGFSDGLNSPLFIVLDVAASVACVNPPTADAGTDQTICESDVASLSGTIGGDATLLTWSTGGNGTFDDATSSTAVYTPGTNDIANGTVTLTLTTDDPDGTGPCTAASDDVIISFETLPTADAGADQAICESDAAYLGATIGGSATSLTWSTNGDGAFDDNTSLTASYVPGAADITSGTVTLTLTTGGSATCTPITDDLVITIVQAHTVDAGPDQVICTTDVANMNGSFGGSATSASWATSGNGSFDDATSLTAVYTPGPADISSGSVTLYLSTSSNTCPIVTDDMIISFSQAITAIDQAGGSVRVGETITIDALNGATLNTGDVITTSVTVDPQKGTVSVNSNGTIDYTASNGFIGSDSFDFQICNQCNLCSTATATVTIENDAPSFTGTTATASPGAPVTIDIISLITDVNNNVDLSSISIVEQPISGALATLDGNSNLIVDYTGVIFFGTDEVVIEVCDFDGACSTATIFIEVAPQEITAYNAVSPNNDGRHDFLEFQYIEGYPDNIVRVFNRWGDIVFEQEGYNNQDKVFDGKANKGASGDLPTGTYFYTVIYQTTDNQSKTVKGFFELRR